MKIAIIHYGEGLQSDVGYRPGRMGQLATRLTSGGHEVWRISPSFNHLKRAQRDTGVFQGASEGNAIVVPTPGYHASRGLQRFKFLVCFVVKSSRALRAMENPPDIIVAGYPPPGMLLACRIVCGSRTRIIGDIRDLWPDAAFRDGGKMKLARLVGKVLALEMQFADQVVGMSSRLVARAPKRVRGPVIPLSANWRDAESQPLVSPDTFTAIFVGSFTQLFAFAPMINGWMRFADSVDGPIPPNLAIYGDGEQAETIRRLAASHPTVQLHGWAPSDAVPDLLAGCDLGVAPNRSGQGLVLANKILEYLEAGCFIVHTLSSSLHDQLDSFGLAVTPDDELSWMTAFSEAYGNRLSIKESRNHRRVLAFDRFGLENVMPLWERALELGEIE